MQREAPGTAWDRAAKTIRQAVPTGRHLGERTWRRPHQMVVTVLLLHVPLLWAFGVWGGEAVGTTWEAYDMLHVTLETGAILALGLLALWPGFGRRLRASFASLGLVSCSAVLAHFAGGFIEAHFHFFVVLPIIAFYQDWVPFVLGALYVTLHHGVLGTLTPEIVYNHSAGQAAPWGWSIIHTGFVLGLAAVLATLTHLQLRADAQRLTAIRQIQREEERMRLVLENTGSIVFAADKDLRYTMMHGRDLAGISLTPEESVGRTAYEVLGDSPEVIVAFERALAGETFADLISFRGRVFHALFRPQRDPKTDEVVGIMACATDITERVRAEKVERDALIQRAKLESLESAEAFRRQLFNTAAHELNTPLTPIQIQLQMLRSGHLGALTPQQRKALEVLDRNMGRLGNLAKDILDVARIQNARLELYSREVDLSRVVSESVESFEAAAQARGIRLDAKVARRLIVKVDERRITQVLYNLLSNATKFTPSGGTIRVTAKRLPDRVRVRVEDSGRGMDQADIGKLFQPFSQVGDERAAQEGSGLGLFITRGIVEAHGGLIWAESDGRGKGSAFTFEIPFDPARPLGPASEKSVRSRATPVRGHRTSGNGARSAGTGSEYDLVARTR